MVSDLLRSRPAAAAAGAALYVARRAGAEIFLPATGAPVTVTAGAGGAFTFGAWTPIATPTNDFWLSHAHIVMLEAIAQLLAGLAELSYGVSNTPLDASRYNEVLNDPTLDSAGRIPLDYTARPVKVPGGQTIYGRAATSVGNANSFRFFLVGWDTAVPTWNALPANTVAGPGRYYDSNVSTTGISLTTGASWAYGSSVTVVDPAPNDLLVTQIILVDTIAQFLLTAMALQVGYGPSNSETWCATVPMGMMLSPYYLHPPVWVKSGERLAIRGAGSGAVGRQVLLKVYDV